MSEERALRVVIADDHAPTRLGVQAALEDGGFDVVASVPNARRAVDEALQLSPDVAVLDVHMPGSGVEAARAITRQLPGTAVVMLTASRDDADLFEALRAGALGYLLKDIDPDRLPDALRAVLRGEAAIPPDLVARVLSEFRAQPKRSLFGTRRSGEQLTSRELEVFELLRQGLSTQDVADRLFVSPVTVRGHVSQVLKKLQVTDREAALRRLEDG